MEDEYEKADFEMKTNEQNRFHPASAWRLRGRLRQLAEDVKNLAVGVESAVTERRWGDVGYCLKHLPRAAAKLAQFYAERKTASAVAKARLHRATLRALRNAAKQ